MTMKERLAQSQAKMDEMKARVAKASEKAKNARQMRREEIEAEMVEIDRAIEELDHQIDAQIADDIATFEGDIAAEETNRAIARERRESKKNTALLKAQMRVNAAKERVAEKKAAKERDAQEKRIADLLDYADRCQETAIAYALEAEANIFAAARETAEYIEKYGE